MSGQIGVAPSSIIAFHSNDRRGPLYLQILAYIRFRSFHRVFTEVAP
jgi:hypothetical protein